MKAWICVCLCIWLHRACGKTNFTGWIPICMPKYMHLYIHECIYRYIDICTHTRLERRAPEVSDKFLPNIWFYEHFFSPHIHTHFSCVCRYDEDRDEALNLRELARCFKCTYMRYVCMYVFMYVYMNPDWANSEKTSGAIHIHTCVLCMNVCLHVCIYESEPTCRMHWCLFICLVFVSMSVHLVGLD
jgi:hypothetical protein